MMFSLSPLNRCHTAGPVTFEITSCCCLETTNKNTERNRTLYFLIKSNKWSKSYIQTTLHMSYTKHKPGNLMKLQIFQPLLTFPCILFKPLHYPCIHLLAVAALWQFLFLPPEGTTGFPVWRWDILACITSSIQRRGLCFHPSSFTCLSVSNMTTIFERFIKLYWNIPIWFHFQGQR